MARYKKKGIKKVFKDLVEFKQDYGDHWFVKYDEKYWNAPKEFISAKSPYIYLYTDAEFISYRRSKRKE